MSAEAIYDEMVEAAFRVLIRTEDVETRRAAGEIFTRAILARNDERTAEEIERLERQRGLRA